MNIPDGIDEELPGLRMIIEVTEPEFGVLVNPFDLTGLVRIELYLVDVQNGRKIEDGRFSFGDAGYFVEDFLVDGFEPLRIGIETHDAVSAAEPFPVMAIEVGSRDGGLFQIRELGIEIEIELEGVLQFIVLEYVTVFSIHP